MTQKFKRVPVRGTTAEELLALWQQGRLYVLAKEEGATAEELLARCQQEALAYVEPASQYATDEWRPHLHRLWTAIVEDRALAAGLVMKQKRQLNRYFVTNLVCYLQVRGIYEPVERVSQLQLHQALEGVAQKNSIYKNMVNYPVSAVQRRRLSALIEETMAGLK